MALITHDLENNLDSFFVDSCTSPSDNIFLRGSLTRIKHAWYTLRIPAGRSVRAMSYKICLSKRGMICLIAESIGSISFPGRSSGSPLFPSSTRSTLDLSIINDAIRERSPSNARARRYDTDIISCFIYLHATWRAIAPIVFRHGFMKCATRRRLSRDIWSLDISTRWRGSSGWQYHRNIV